MYRIPIYKVQLVRDSSQPSPQKQFRDSAGVYEFASAYLEGADREHLIVLLLDNKNRLIGVNTVSIGSLNGAVVHPREVFKPAILSNSAAIILCHNHPSGVSTPSSEDREVTKRAVRAGHILGIRVLDHIIIGDDEHFSFADAGELNGKEGGL
jgi:DNA repair protein RadC